MSSSEFTGFPKDCVKCTVTTCDWQGFTQQNEACFDGVIHSQWWRDATCKIAIILKNSFLLLGLQKLTNKSLQFSNGYVFLGIMLKISKRSPPTHFFRHLRINMRRTMSRGPRVSLACDVVALRHTRGRPSLSCAQHRTTSLLFVNNSCFVNTSGVRGTDRQKKSRRLRRALHTEQDEHYACDAPNEQQPRNATADAHDKFK